jgi:hypothetical protein
MPESVAAVGSYFAAEGGAAAGAAAAGGTAQAAGVMGATAASGAGAGYAGAAAAAGTAGAGGGLLGTLGTEAASAAVSGVASSLLAPKRPDLPKPTAMPDPLAVEEARKRSLIEQMARRGRASTILTDSAGDKLGG